jgi:hypothetical protein
MSDDEVDLLAAIDAVRGVEPVEEEEPEEKIPAGVTVTEVTLPSKGPAQKPVKVRSLGEFMEFMNDYEPAQKPAQPIQEEVPFIGDGDRALKPSVVKDLIKVAQTTGQTLAAVTDSYLSMARSASKLSEGMSEMSAQMAKVRRSDLLAREPGEYAYRTLCKQIEPRLELLLDSAGFDSGWRLKIEAEYAVRRQAVVVVAYVEEVDLPLGFSTMVEPARPTRHLHKFIAEAYIPREAIECGEDVLTRAAQDLAGEIRRQAKEARGG